MNKLVLPLAAAVLASVAALNSWLRLTEVRTQAAAVRARISELQSQRLAAGLQSAPPSMQATPSVSPAPTTQPAGAELPAQPSNSARPNERSATDALADVFRQQFATPEGRELLYAQLRLAIPEQYPGLGRELGLSPAELEKLYDILARQQSNLTADTMTTTGDQPQDAAARQERQRKRAEMRQASEAELKATLGSKHAQWQEYQKTLPLRQQVSQLQASLGSGNNALSDSQARPLVTALAAEQARIREEQRLAPAPANRQGFQETQRLRRAEESRRLLDVAAGHLTTQQLDGYRRMLEQEESLNRRMQEIVITTP
jgi:hypothetical protein